MLPGKAAFAFDLSGSRRRLLVQHPDAGRVQPDSGDDLAAGLRLRGYLAVVMTLFVRGLRARRRSRPPARPAAAPDAPTPARRRPAWVVPAAVVAVPALLAGLAVAFADPKPAAAQTVAVSEKDCGEGFTAPEPGRQTFQMHNTGDKTAEVYLIDPATNAVYGEIEGLAPGTTRALVGHHRRRHIRLAVRAQRRHRGHLRGRPGHRWRAAKAVVPVSEHDLSGAARAVPDVRRQGLTTLVRQTPHPGRRIRRNHLGEARTDWLTAHRTYAALGAAYGTFEDFDQKINGRADGLPDGVTTRISPASTASSTACGTASPRSLATRRPATRRRCRRPAESLPAPGLRPGRPAAARPRDPGEHPAVRTHRRHGRGQRHQSRHRPRPTSTAPVELLTVLRPLIARRNPHRAAGRRRRTPPGCGRCSTPAAPTAPGRRSDKLDADRAGQHQRRDRSATGRPRARPGPAGDPEVRLMNRRRDPPTTPSAQRAGRLPRLPAPPRPAAAARRALGAGRRSFVRSGARRAAPWAAVLAGGGFALPSRGGPGTAQAAPRTARPSAGACRSTALHQAGIAHPAAGQPPPSSPSTSSPTTARRAGRPAADAHRAGAVPDRRRRPRRPGRRRSALRQRRPRPERARRRPDRHRRRRRLALRRPVRARGPQARAA